MVNVQQEQGVGGFNMTPVLVTVLILAAYFIGVLQTRAEFLEKRGVATADVEAVNAVAPPSNVLPTAGPQKAAKEPELSEDDYVRGNKKARVVLVEYSDMECPYCKMFHPTMQQVISEFGDEVKWVYRHFPLSFHVNAQKESEAAECAGKLGGNEAFWKYVDKIFERTTSNGSGFALDALVPLSGEVGLNKTKFKTCLDNGEFSQKVKDQMADGTNEGVTGTPGTIIIDGNGNTQLVPGAIPYEQLKPMIEQALAASN